MFLYWPVKLPMHLMQPYLLLYRLRKLTFLNQLLMNLNCFFIVIQQLWRER